MKMHLIILTAVSIITLAMTATSILSNTVERKLNMNNCLKKEKIDKARCASHKNNYMNPSTSYRWYVGS